MPDAKSKYRKDYEDKHPFRYVAIASRPIGALKLKTDKEIRDFEQKQISETLLNSKASIIEAWKKQIQVEIPGAFGKSQTALEDDMPLLLDQMAQTILLGSASGTTPMQEKLSKKHGRQRANLERYTLEEVLEEYRIAREIIIHELNKETHLSAESQCLLNRVLDRAIIESCTEFANLKNLENTTAKLEAEQARIQAECANQAKSEFLANMSHEIRTPLGAILGFTDLMREPSLSYSDRIRFAEIVNRNGRQLSTLINDILDISKIEAGHLNVEQIPVSLSSIVAEVTTLFRKVADNKGIVLDVNAWYGIPDVVISDPTRLTQILSNLIANAIKFTSNGRVLVTLTKTDSKTNDEYQFAVEDTGIGISEFQKTRLFQPFSQADTTTSRTFGGSGLGLFLSRNLAIALGGDLALTHSRIGEGSRFTASFVAAPSENVAEEVVFSSLGLEFQLKGVRILLAEDSPDNQMLVSRYLIKEGATIDLANNGHEAISMINTNSYDIVLMDIQMPVLNGYEAAKVLRGEGYTKPIIALTANAMSEEKENAFDAGFDAHLTKPIHRIDLIATLKKYSHVKE